MSTWAQYWSTASVVRVKPFEFRFLKNGDMLEVFIDSRPGRTFGTIYLYARAGEKGSVMANGEEAAFIEKMIGD